MSERPTAAELVAAARDFLEGELLPTLEDERLRFRTRVAANALAIAGRELGAPPSELDGEELSELARRIRAGDVPPGTLDLLERHVAAKLAIVSPRYLERYGPAP
jgi:Domain of unknown function (DUF6285)